ncbi:MAG: efflux RND transporter periplasmic adaptor subunit [Chitinophagaceae bacterium]|mgnify:CR=1 FL=1|jgi:membrane fusion protein (multidrug efflux system)|nr:efflux RND transporter periplasmic adaptor subunit [Chitinophagaceae bacterium]MBP9739596.1 efflux RND transporter periplasmic adaptor subunit [Chitinophagaceae bacterium]
MQRFYYKITALILVVSLTACGGKDQLTQKKNELEKLKKEQTSLTDKIKNLETDIAKLDTSVKKDDIAKLVGVSDVTAQNFVHYIDLQGHVDADNISYISPRLGPGQVKAVYVKKGDYVKQGQLLLKLDDAVVKQSIAAAKQSLETLKTQLSFAKDLYNRQNNLWKQGIGTEVQLISAKNNVETLEKQLKAGEENIKTVQEQANATNVYSDVDGIADEVNIRVGETFSGIGAMGAQIKIVNTSSLKVVTDVPENYAGKVKVGSKVLIVLPDINKTYNSSISLSGKTINTSNRSFSAEAKLPYDGVIRPNQNAQVRIEDYAANNAIVIPVNTVNTDETGKYVFVAVQEGNKLVARKKTIVIGESYNQLIEVKSGITANEKLITDGYQGVYDGQIIKVQ